MTAQDDLFGEAAVPVASHVLDGDILADGAVAGPPVPAASSAAAVGLAPVAATIPQTGTDAGDSLVGSTSTGDSDQITGLSGDDTIVGNGGADILYGNAGSDQISGGTEDDEVHGGRDADTVYGGAGNDLLYGNLGADLIYGGQGDDTIYGGQDGDEIHGDVGNDVLRGDKGNDTLSGGDGEDTLNGGSGDDVLDGGDLTGSQGGLNDFVFEDGSGNDTITGFILTDPSANEASGDAIEVEAGVNGTAIASVADLLARTSDNSDGHAVVDLGGGNTVTLVGIRTSQLNDYNFFVG